MHDFVIKYQIKMNYLVYMTIKERGVVIKSCEFLKILVWTFFGKKWYQATSNYKCSKTWNINMSQYSTLWRQQLSKMSYHVFLWKNGYYHTFPFERGKLFNDSLFSTLYFLKKYLSWKLLIFNCIEPHQPLL